LVGLQELFLVFYSRQHPTSEQFP
jgi:hypothetical protein